MAIAPDDIRPGMLVTVLYWRANKEPVTETRVEPLFGFSVGITATGRCRDRSFMGDVLEIVAVSLPYVVVRASYLPNPVKLDTREAELVPLAPAYVEALQRKATP